MKDSQFIHTYKARRGYKRPIITTALKLDLDSSGKVRGVGVGFSYCSNADRPNKKVGRMIAMSRANNIIEKYDGDNNAFTGPVKKYRNKQWADTDNGGPRVMTHVHSLYIPLPLAAPNQLDLLPMPEDSNVYTRLILALANIEKFGQL